MKTTKWSSSKLLLGYIVFLILLLMTQTINAQTLTLKDQQTLEPIPFANIVSKQLLISPGNNTTFKDSIRKGTTTDINGQADLSIFKSDVILITISFIGYESRHISKEEMAKKDLSLIHI